MYVSAHPGTLVILVIQRNVDRIKVSVCEQEHAPAEWVAHFPVIITNDLFHTRQHRLQPLVAVQQPLVVKVLARLEKLYRVLRRVEGILLLAFGSHSKLYDVATCTPWTSFQSMIQMFCPKFKNLHWSE